MTPWINRFGDFIVNLLLATSGIVLVILGFFVFG